MTWGELKQWCDDNGVLDDVDVLIIQPDDFLLYNRHLMVKFDDMFPSDVDYDYKGGELRFG